VSPSPPSPGTDLDPLVETARKAAIKGGEVVRDDRGARAALAKAAGDYVTEVDTASERAIKRLLESETPHVPILGEEEGGEGGDLYWAVDPLDGTTNYVHRFPIVGVSVALVQDGSPILGAVHAPFLGTTWTAARGSGAFRDGEPIKVSSRPVSTAVVGTGFPFRHKERLPRYLGAMEGALHRFEDLRRPGAASLDLAWVAEGVFDGFFELGLAGWDVAAGGLLIEEAGGVVTDWAGGTGWFDGDIIAGSPAVHAELLRLVSEASA